MNWADRLRIEFEATGWSKAKLARDADVPYDSVIKYLSGKVDQPRGDTLKRLALALGKDPIYIEKGIDPLGGSWSAVPLMGFIGAGGEILPEDEQIPEEGLEQIDVPFALPAEMVAFRIKGTSMLPRYDPDDVLVVWRDQRRPLHTFFQEEAAVRLLDGRRYLKVIEQSGEDVDLRSWNDATIRSVQIEWIGEIYATIRASQVRRMQYQIDRLGGFQGQLQLPPKRPRY